MRIFYLSCLSTWQEPLCTPFLDWTHCLVLGSISEREVNQKNLEKIFFLHLVCICYTTFWKKICLSLMMTLWVRDVPFIISSSCWIIMSSGREGGIYLDLPRKVQKNPKSDDPWEDSKRSLALIESLFLHSILGDKIYIPT